MAHFLVTLRRTIEWQNEYTCDDQALAEDLAKQEAHHGTIVDEQIITEQVD